MRTGVLVAVLSFAPQVAATDAPSIADLAWLSGCWALEGREQGSGEQWMPPAGGSMLGMNRVVSDGKIVAWEFIRLVEEEDGTLAFIASPSGQQTARFPLLRMEGDEVVFENLEHDFPQRVIYRLLDHGDLHGRVEGMIDGELRQVDFPMTRTDCIGPALANK